MTFHGVLHRIKQLIVSIKVGLGGGICLPLRLRRTTFRLSLGSCVWNERKDIVGLRVRRRRRKQNENVTVVMVKNTSTKKERNK